MPAASHSEGTQLDRQWRPLVLHQCCRLSSRLLFPSGLRLASVSSYLHLAPPDMLCGWKWTRLFEEAVSVCRWFLFYLDPDKSVRVDEASDVQPMFPSRGATSASSLCPTGVDVVGFCDCTTLPKNTSAGNRSRHLEASSMLSHFPESDDHQRDPSQQNVRVNTESRRSPPAGVRQGAFFLPTRSPTQKARRVSGLSGIR